MSNAEIAKKAYEYFGSGDISSLLNLYSQDIKWTTPKIENAVFSGSRQGKDALVEFFEQLGEAEEFSRFEPKEFIAQGDKVVVLGEFTATVKATGNTYSAEWVHVTTFKDGKITEFQEYFDTGEANRAHLLHAAA
jgi:uncharacterized protein